MRMCMCMYVYVCVEECACLFVTVICVLIKKNIHRKNNHTIIREIIRN